MKIQYLQLQKENMAALKRTLHQQRTKEERAAQNLTGVELLPMVPNVIVEVKADEEIIREKVKVNITNIQSDFTTELFGIGKCLLKLLWQRPPSFPSCTHASH